ncbi:MAG: beta-eliminating lyase-related protein [Pseudomonadota bacterium]
MMFASDNWAGAAPEIIDAIARANDGPAPAYGGDPLTARVEERFNDVFDCKTSVYFVSTGGAANGLALSAFTPPYGMIIAHEESHIQMDECGGVELLTGGAKILPVAGAAAKLTPDALDAALGGFPDRAPHGCPPRAVSLTQATECGAVYAPEELHAVCARARAAGLKVHMDGARFANAVSHLGCAPADISWRAGVDVLCFGATKNGCLAAEAVVFFGDHDAEDFAYRRKRAGHLWSKQRFIAAQFDAYFTDDLWLRLAAHANAAARRLADGLAAIDGVTIWYPTQANEVFASFPDGVDEALRAAGAAFYPWVTPGDPANGTMQRLICSFRTKMEDVDAFVARAEAVIPTFA